MTRINSSINPVNLTDQHLIAELRELPRIFTSVNKRIDENKGFNDIPDKFTLGTGHMKFFYNKLSYLQSRHSRLIQEYNLRFDKYWQYPIMYSQKRLDQYLENKLFRYYEPSIYEKELLIERISTRILNSKQIPRYCKLIISKEEAIEILKGNCIIN